MTAREVLELRAAVDERRRQLGLRWWQISVQADVGEKALWRMSYGVASLRTRTQLQEWLHRHTDPPTTAHEIKQGGNDDDSGDNGG